MPKRIHQMAMLLALAAAGAGLVACGGSAGGPASPSPSLRTYTEAQSGQTVTAAVGDEIAVTLAENPSTGYQWKMKAGAGLTVVRSTFTGPAPSPTPMVGAGGTRMWIVKVDRAGTLKLAGVYARPWESAAKSAATFSLTVTAQ